jgi:alkylresorcinol/alkylpyrone synthase
MRAQWAAFARWRGEDPHIAGVGFAQQGAQIGGPFQVISGLEFGLKLLHRHFSPPQKVWPMEWVKQGLGGGRKHNTKELNPSGPRCEKCLLKESQLSLDCLKGRGYVGGMSQLRSPSIASVATAVPPHYLPQAELTEALMDLWSQYKPVNRSRIKALHQSVQVDGRHLAVSKEANLPLDTFEKRNEVYIQVAVQLGAEAITKAVEKAGLRLEQLDVICFTSITGLATPSIDARLVNVLKLRPDIKRLPIFGLGCVAGVAGTSRVSDLLRGFPQQNAVLLSVELCSLTVQRQDNSISNIIAAGLFGDGAAAMVIRGADSETYGPQVLATESVFYPDTEGVMGWEFKDSGFNVVLSADVPTMVTKNIRGNVDGFLAKHHLKRSDISHWVAHTGGPKVLEAFESALELPPDALKFSWQSLKAVGNLSSASVMFVMKEVIDSQQAKPGDFGLMMAMGPGFCAELVLLKW